MMRWLALALLSSACWGQLVLSVVDGATETPLAANSLYQMKPMESGDTQSVRLRVRNTGTQAALITRFSVDGTGFSLNRPLPPQTLAVGGLLNATLTFDAITPANYLANLQLNNATTTVLVTVLAGPQLTIPSTCTSTAVNTIDFGTVLREQPRTCELTVTNPSAQAMAISTLTVTGTGFALQGAAPPLALGAGQSAAFAIQVLTQTTGVFTGTLKIQNREYALRAVSANPPQTAPLPVPIFEIDSSAAMSGQQRRLTMRLPSPSPVTALGQVNLSFIADSISAADDSAVMFVETSSRQVQFAVEEGKTTVTLNAAPFVTFQTGTTAGRIRFTLSGIAGPAAEAESTVILAPLQIALDKVLPARFLDRLELVLIGFDNTLSAGSMSFRFFDAGSRPITASLPADFTSAFRAFYSGSPGGGAFKLTVRFPITGNSAGVASVEAQMSNSAGTIFTGRINF